MRSNPIPLLLVVFAVAVWFALAPTWPAPRPAVVLSSRLLGGAVGLTRTLGPMWDYRLRWIWVVAGDGHRVLGRRRLPGGPARTCRRTRVITAIVATALARRTVRAERRRHRERRRRPIPPDPVLTARTTPWPARSSAICRAGAVSWSCAPRRSARTSRSRG